MQTNDTALAALAAELGQALAAAGWRLALAESCTGGWIAKVITDIAGSSGWFDCGIVSYSNAAKIRLLDVSPALLDMYGAVSEPVAGAMAEGVRAGAQADLAAAVSGIAGPGGGSADKPVGTVCFGWSRRDGRSIAETKLFPGDREAVRRQAVAYTLQRLLQMLRED